MKISKQTLIKATIVVLGIIITLFIIGYVLNKRMAVWNSFLVFD